jgi:hypothetical protein
MPNRSSLHRSRQEVVQSKEYPRHETAQCLAAASRFGIVQSRAKSAIGEVAEWLKAHAWKVCRRDTVSRVRIPPSPPNPGQSYPQQTLHFLITKRLPPLQESRIML